MLNQKRFFLAYLTSFIFIFTAKAQLTSNFNFGKGIQFKSEDGSFDLTMKSRIQSLYFVSSSLGNNFSDNLKSGALVRRSRLKFDGQANEKVEFKFEFGLSNRDIGPMMKEMNSTANIVLDAVLMYNLNDNTQIWFGQTKLPGNRERVISSQNLQFVDRSQLNSFFNIDRDMGIQFRHTSTFANTFIVKEIGSISQGEGRNITANNFGGYDYTLRIEFLPFGEFSKKGDYVASAVNFVQGEKNDDDGKLSIGASYDFNSSTSRSAGQLGSFVFDSLNNYAHANIETIFIDAMYKYKRISYMGEYAKRKSTASEEYYQNQFYTGWSYNNQIGCMLSSKSEIAFRHTHVNGDRSGILDMFTLGFSRYANKHNLKFQTDFSITTKEGQTPIGLFRFQTEVAF